MKEIKFELVIVNGKVHSGKTDFIHYAFSEKPNYLILDPIYIANLDEDIDFQVSLIPLNNTLIDSAIQASMSILSTWLEDGCKQNLVLEIPSIPYLKIYEKKIIDLVTLAGGFVRKVEIHAEENRLAYLEEMAASDGSYISSSIYVEEFLDEVILTLESSLISENQENQIKSLVYKN